MELRQAPSFESRRQGICKVFIGNGRPGNPGGSQDKIAVPEAEKNEKFINVLLQGRTLFAEPIHLACSFCLIVFHKQQFFHHLLPEGKKVFFNEEFRPAKAALGEENCLERVFIVKLLLDKNKPNTVAGAVGFLNLIEINNSDIS